jgi:hypothetical protein
MTVAGVVADKLFHRAKFVDQNSDLVYDEKDGSICKFVTTFCYLQANIEINTWWKQACKWIPTNISGYTTRKVWSCNGMNWAFLVRSVLLNSLFNSSGLVSNIYGFSSNVDWLTQDRKIAKLITKAKHKDMPLSQHSTD